MATLTYGTIKCDVHHATRGADYVHGYDAKGNLVIALDGLADVDEVKYSGTFMYPDECVEEKCNNVKHVAGMLCRDDGQMLRPEDYGTMGCKADSTYTDCYYRQLDGGVKEWVNPPMVPGVEYRTTQRFNGNPVYTKLIMAGALSSSGLATFRVDTDEDPITQVKSFRAMAFYDDNQLPVDAFPVFTSSGTLMAIAYVGASDAGKLYVYIKSMIDMSRYQASIVVEYTKVPKGGS